MIHLNIWLTVKDEADIDTVRGLLTEMGALSREEPGCLRYLVFQSKNDPKVFMLGECWESEEILDQHREAEGYKTIYKPQVLPLVDRVPHPSDLLE